MRRSIYVAALCLLGAPGFIGNSDAADLDCTAFLTGQWAGKGDFDGFGEKTELDNLYTFGADGMFKTVNRYRRDGGDWTEQEAQGKWTAAKGQDDASCEVTMTSGEGDMSASSVSEYLRVDDNAFTTMEFRMDRVP